jgi:hypothetical protein
MMQSLKLLGITAVFGIFACSHEKNLEAGRYAVADSEYSQDNYDLRRDFRGDGTFSEAHSLSNCLMMEMEGHWIQENNQLQLNYSTSRQRTSCKQDLPEFKADSAHLTIPIRHVEGESFESFLTASGGKPEKWLRWNRKS